MAAPDPRAPAEAWPVPHDARSLGERGLREAMTRLESVWPEPRARIGRDSEKARIAGHMRDHLTPLFEVLQWIFALHEHFRGRGGSYARDVAAESAGQVVGGLSLMRNRAAHQLAPVLDWWLVPVDVPEDWAERPHRIERFYTEGQRSHVRRSGVRRRAGYPRCSSWRPLCRVDLRRGAPATILLGVAFMGRTPGCARTSSGKGGG